MKIQISWVAHRLFSNLHFLMSFEMALFEQSHNHAVCMLDFSSQYEVCGDESVNLVEMKILNSKFHLPALYLSSVFLNLLTSIFLESMRW